jgi:hypothetical protein
VPTESGLSLEAEAERLAVEWGRTFRLKVAGDEGDVGYVRFAGDMVASEAVAEVQSTLSYAEFEALCGLVAALLIEGFV